MGKKKHSEDVFEVDIGEIGKMFGVDLNLKGIKVKKTSKDSREVELISNFNRLYDICKQQRNIIIKQANKIKELESSLSESGGEESEEEKGGNSNGT